MDQKPWKEIKLYDKEKLFTKRSLEDKNKQSKSKTSQNNNKQTKPKTTITTKHTHKHTNPVQYTVHGDNL